MRFRRIFGFYRLLFKRFYHFFDVITGGGGEDIRFLFNISGNLFFYNGTLDPWMGKMIQWVEEGQKGEGAGEEGGGDVYRRIYARGGN